MRYPQISKKTTPHYYCREIIMRLLTNIIRPAIKHGVKMATQPAVLYDSIPMSVKSKRRLGSVRKKTLILDLDETLIKVFSGFFGQLGRNEIRFFETKKSRKKPFPSQMHYRRPFPKNQYHQSPFSPTSKSKFIFSYYQPLFTLYPKHKQPHFR